MVADEREHIAAKLREWADAGHALILTTGGTGLSARDVTPEATREVLEREVPGIAEWMSVRGMEQTKLAVLSRAMARTTQAEPDRQLTGFAARRSLLARSDRAFDPTHCRSYARQNRPPMTRDVSACYFVNCASRTKGP